MIYDYFRKLWNRWDKKRAVKTEGILSENSDFSLLEKILSHAEKLPKDNWEKKEDHAEYFNGLWDVQEGMRKYSTKIDLFQRSGSPYRNNNEVYMHLINYWKINHCRSSGEPVGGIISYGLNISSGNEILGSANGKKIEQLFKTIEKNLKKPN